MKEPTIKDVQQFWNERPVNRFHSQAKVGTKQYYDEVYARRSRVEPHILPFLTDGVDPNFSGKMLEMGSGIGTDALMAARMWPKAQIVGIDISQESLKIARKGAKVYKLKNVTFYKGNIESLPAKILKNEYDLIYSYGVLHHTLNPERAVEEIKKVCHRNTIVKVMLYNKYSWKAFWLWIKDRSLKNSEAQQGSPVTYAYSTKEVKELFRDFEILDHHIDFIFPYKVNEYIQYQYEHFWYWPIIKHFKHLIGFHHLLTMKPQIKL